MLNINLIKELKNRGLILNITNEKKLIKKLKNKYIFLYCGFDPTAESLHLGHLIPLIFLKRFKLAGHNPLILIGGATGLIGDPSFKKKERKLNNYNKINICIKKIKKQILFIMNSNNNIIVNNYEWFNKINIIYLLRNIGKYFSVNKMIKKEIIKNRLNKNNNISFTEFTYTLLQSYDFVILNKIYKVILQIGGSDQWSNIISGVDLTKKLNKNIVFGLTLPIIINDNGIKFGKTEKNTIWLDSNKTSSYKFYQFWLNIKDNNIYYFLKIFTLLDLKYINILKKNNFKNKQIPYAKYILAEELTLMVHGIKKLNSAKNITNSLFNGEVNNLNKYDLEQLFKNGIPKILINKEILIIDLQQILIMAKLAKSRKQATNMIIANAIQINEKKCTKLNYFFKDIDKLYGCYTLIKKGKKNYCLIYWE